MHTQTEPSGDTNPPPYEPRRSVTASGSRKPSLGGGGIFATPSSETHAQLNHVRGRLVQLHRALSVSSTTKPSGSGSGNDPLSILQGYDIVFLVEYVFKFSIVPAPHCHSWKQQ